MKNIRNVTWCLNITVSGIKIQGIKINMLIFSDYIEILMENKNYKCLFIKKLEKT